MFFVEYKTFGGVWEKLWGPSSIGNSLDPSKGFATKSEAEKYIKGRAAEHNTEPHHYRVVEKESKPEPEKEDVINSPSHYARLNPQPREVMRKWGLNSNLAPAIKYIARAGYKPGSNAVDDLKKAISYLEYEIQCLENKC